MNAIYMMAWLAGNFRNNLPLSFAPPLPSARVLKQSGIRFGSHGGILGVRDNVTMSGEDDFAKETIVPNYLRQDS